MKTMKLLCWTALCALGLPDPAAAQNLVVSNARVLDGNGGVIDGATIVVSRGRIASVSEGPAPPSDSPVLDAGGMTVIPAFIDAHRRVIHGDPDQWMEQVAERMQEYLEAGFTTVLSTGDSFEHILALRDQLEAREITGPRLVLTGTVPLTREGGGMMPEEAVRETVRELTLAGVDAVVSVAAPGGPEHEILAAVKQEADEQGLLNLSHVDSVEDADAAVRAGSGYITRTPHVGELNAQTARRIVQAGRPNAEYGLVMTSALGASTLSDPDSRGPAHARLFYDAQIIYGFGTATAFPPRDALRHELGALQGVFTNEEILGILTRDAAFAVRRDDALGTLERGKFADILILEGDPLTDLDSLLDIEVVIKTGLVVVDNR